MVGKKDNLIMIKMSIYELEGEKKDFCGQIRVKKSILKDVDLLENMLFEMFSKVIRQFEKEK